MLKKIRSHLLSIWRGKHGNISKQKQQSDSEFHTGKLYTSITQITLEQFIKALCDNDLSVIVISGKVPTHILELRWEEIYEQFLDGMKDSEGIRKLKLLGKINNLEFTYKLIQLCVQFLSKAYDREVITVLKNHIRVTGEFNPEDQDGYFNDLQVVLNRAQKILIDIENKKAEYAVIKGKETDGEQMTRKHFDRLIAQVSLFTKFHIDKRSTTVGEFVEYYGSMRESHEAMEREFEKTKRK